MDAPKVGGRWLVASLVAALLAPGAASAATLSTNKEDGRYSFVAVRGEANQLTVDGTATDYTFTDVVPIDDEDAACVRLTPNSLRCPRISDGTPMNQVFVILAVPPLLAPPDTAPNTFEYTGVPPAGTASERGVRVETGLANTDDRITGSSGRDEVRTYGGSDTVSTGGGNDLVTDTGGAKNTFFAGPGNDDVRVAGATTSSVLAVVHGGDGSDYLEGGDQMFGEGGADHLFNHGDYGDFDAAHGDVLNGGAGPDLLQEAGDSTDCDGTHSDTNVGGPGKDTVYDDCGLVDVFKLADGEQDKFRCGGFVGSVDADRLDLSYGSGCLKVKIVKKPPHQTSGRSATFRFKGPGAFFECKRDGGSFKRCGSPKTYTALKPGSHVFQVRAVENRVGAKLTGIPAKYGWKIG